jgi:hypothetical protein
MEKESERNEREMEKESERDKERYRCWPSPRKCASSIPDTHTAAKGGCDVVERPP